MSGLGVLFEDNHLLVVLKPANMPVQADDSGDADLLSIAKQYVKQRYGKPGDVYLGLVHRLDRPVSGILVFARTSKAARRLADSMKSGQWRKTYFAIVQGNPQQHARLTHYLVREGTFSRVASEHAAEAKQAVLDYRLLGEREGLSLLRIELVTGRHHQIRVQLGDVGLPVWGDMRYNPSARKSLDRGSGGQRGSIALFAGALSFPHPVSGQRMDFNEIPRAHPFSLFSEAVFRIKNYDAVFECGDFAIVVKPQGMETCAADSPDGSLEGLTGLRACHRLDAMAAGLVVMARSESARRAFELAFEQRSIKKTYECICVGSPPEHARLLHHYIVKDAEKARVSVFDAPRPEAREALMRYEVLSRGEYSHIRVTLITGRTHQIRAQLAHVGCPILGDDKYGDRAANKRAGVKTLQLSATRLELHFPVGSPLFRYDGRVFEQSAQFAPRALSLLE